MPRDDQLFLADILEAIGRIRQYIKGLDEAHFCNDHKTQDAVIRNLEIIGEASRKLSNKARTSAPDTEWNKIVALRNILSHEYFGVSLSILWNVIQVKLGPLKTTCQILQTKVRSTKTKSARKK
jgi:uncharacterized protein with HEPN domain